MASPMILVTEALLNDADLSHLRKLFDEVDDGEGAQTAVGDLQSVKHNRQLHLGVRSTEVRDRVRGALNRHPFLSYALIPKAISPPLLSVYKPGMYYGDHTDGHLGQLPDRAMRLDISATIFLDPPETYDGGELVIRSSDGDRTYKLPAGAAVFYPTYFVHRVNEVTRGERRACVMWFESFVKDTDKRRMLFELQQVRSWIEENQPVTSKPRQTMVNLCENLHRLWIDT